MPVIKSKVIRVRDADGIWHDLPATVSEESMRAAERAAAAELTATEAARRAVEAEASAAISATAAVDAADYLEDAVDGIRVETVTEPEISQGGISSENGGTQPATNPNHTKRLHTENYFRVGLSASFTVPEGFEAYWYKYTGQAIAYYIGNSGEWLTGDVRLTGDYYYKLAFRTPSNDVITPSDLDGFEITTYSQTDETLTRAGKSADAKTVGDEIGSLQRSVLNNIDDYVTDKELKGKIYEPGYIDVEDGRERNSSAIDASYKRSDFLYFPQGTKLTVRSIRAVTDCAVIAVYDKAKNYDAEHSVAGYTTSNDVNVDLVMPYDGYVRFSALTSHVEDTTIRNATGKTPLNILCLGNSFSQDSFAYVPPILNELLPEYAITYCVGYIGSAGIAEQVQAYKNDSAYTWCNVWKPYDTRWNRYAGGGAREKSFSELFALADHWDVIYTQGHGQVRRDGETDYDSIDENIVQAGRELCRILQKEQAAPFAYLTGKWLSTGTEGEDVYGETVFESMTDGMEYVRACLGVNDVIHIGTAIQNARTNAVFDDLGHVGDVNTGTDEEPVWEHLNPGHLLYNTHQQSGIPALLSAYMIVLKILELVGRRATSIYGSTFAPTTENCIAINAYKADGMVSPLPMTHGESVGVDDGEGNILWDNIRAAQEIAVLAHNNPDVITDCSDVIVSD